MSAQEPTAQERPRTRVCPVCAVEINAASARCPYCGARQFKRQPILGRRGILICVVAVAVAVFVTRAVIDASNRGLRYVPYRSPDLVALVPDGYSDELLAGPHGTAVAGFVDPSQSADSEVIKATAPVGATPHARALALAATLRNTHGVALGAVTSDTLAGGQPASEVLYTLAGVYYAVSKTTPATGTSRLRSTLSAHALGMRGAITMLRYTSFLPILSYRIRRRSRTHPRPPSRPGR